MYVCKLFVLLGILRTAVTYPEFRKVRLYRNEIYADEDVMLDEAEGYALVTVSHISGPGIPTINLHDARAGFSVLKDVTHGKCFIHKFTHTMEELKARVHGIIDNGGEGNITQFYTEESTTPVSSEKLHFYGDRIANFCQHYESFFIRKTLQSKRSITESGKEEAEDSESFTPGNLQNHNLSVMYENASAVISGYDGYRIKTVSQAKLKMSQRRRFTCNIRSKSFSSKYSLNSHIRNIHTESQSTLCSYCDKRLSSLSAKSRHESNIHLGAKQHACELCDKRFFYKKDLNGHVRSHHPEKGLPKLSCEKCDNVYNHRASLQLHVKECGKNAKTFKCTDCSRVYQSKRALDLHMSSKHSGKVYICENCGESFQYKYCYDRHLKRKHGNP